MKKIILCIFLALGCFISNVSHIEASEYFYEEMITVDSDLQTRATSTKTGTKTVNVKNSSGKVLWSVSVKGTFTYNGSTATCTNASVSTNINESGWKVVNSSSSKSGNKATGYAKVNCYRGGVLIDSLSKTVTLTCSATGKLS